MSDLIELYNHPNYDANYSEIKKAEALYFNERFELVKSAYLWPHELEMGDTDGAKKIRRQRENRSTYTNYLNPILSIWQSLFLYNGISIDETSKRFLEENNLWRNIDGKNTDFESFIRDYILRDYFLYGSSCDYARATEAPTTAAEDDGTFKAFIEHIDTIGVVDWQFNSFGKLQFIRFEYDQILSREKPTDRITSVRESKTIQIVDGSLIISYYQADSEAVQSGESAKWQLIKTTLLPGFSEIPIEFITGRESWAKDILDLCLKFYNIESAIDNNLLYQGYQKIFIIGQPDAINKAVVAEHSWVTLPEGTSVATIEPLDTSSMERRGDVVRNAIFRIGLNQIRQMTADSGSAQSADSVNAERDYTKKLVESEKGLVETYIEKLIIHLGNYYGIQLQPEVSISFIDTATDLIQAIQLISVFRPEFNKLPELKKALVGWAVEKLNLSNEDALKLEIENTDFTVKDNISANLFSGLDGE